MALKKFFRFLLGAAGGGVHPTLDLHGLAVKDALRAAADFVETSCRKGISPVRIVYGKGLGSPGGRGILREVIPRWCENEGRRWVRFFKREVDLRGGDGSILVFLRSPAAPEDCPSGEEDRPGPVSA
jgi:DNA-nicking Smr family endonuclease